MFIKILDGEGQNPSRDSRIRKIAEAISEALSHLSTPILIEYITGYAIFSRNDFPRSSEIQTTIVEVVGDSDLLYRIWKSVSEAWPNSCLVLGPSTPPSPSWLQGPS